MSGIVRVAPISKKFSPGAWEVVGVCGCGVAAFGPLAPEASTLKHWCSEFLAVLAPVPALLGGAALPVGLR